MSRVSRIVKNELNEATYPKGYCAIYKQFIKCGDESLGRLAYRNSANGNSITQTIDNMIEWCVSNCDNVNDVLLANAMAFACYDLCNVYNQNIEDYIDEKVGELVDEGVIKEW